MRVPARMPLWVAAVITDDAGSILLGRFAATGAWDLPGGYLRLGEDPVRGLRRTVGETAGAVVSVWWLAGMHSHVRDGLTLVFLGRRVGGVVVPGGDAEQLRWVIPAVALRLLWPGRADQLRGALSEADPQRVVTTAAGRRPAGLAEIAARPPGAAAAAARRSGAVS